jgi:tape measure domain-containing protein
LANVVTLQVTVNSQGAVQGARVVNQALSGIQSQAQKTHGAVHQLNVGFQTLRDQLFSLRGAFAGIGIGLFLRELVEVNSAFNQIETTLFAASGSAQLVASDFAFVRQEALRLGADVTKTGVEFARLAAAAKGTSLEGNTIRDVFSATVEAFVATGQSADQARLGIFALQQMISKGRVQAEELRGQFGERLPGAFAAAARALGVSTAQLNKMLELGQVTAEQLLPRLAEELRKTFGPAFEEATKRPRFAIGQFQATLKEFLFTISNTGFMDNFAKATRELTKVLGGPEGAKLAAFIGGTLDVAATAAAKSVIFLANNIDILTAALAGLAASRVVSLLSSLIPILQMVTGLFLGLAGAASGVFGAIAISVGVAAGALYYYRDTLLEVYGEQARVRDFVVVAWEYIKNVVSEFAVFMGRQLTMAWDEFMVKVDNAIPKFKDWGMAAVNAIDTMILKFRYLGIVIDEYATFFWTSFKAVLADLTQRFEAFVLGVRSAMRMDFEASGQYFAKTFGDGLDLGLEGVQYRIQQRFGEISGDRMILQGLEVLGQKGAEILKKWAQEAGNIYENEMEIQRRLGQLGAAASQKLKDLEAERERISQNRRGQADEMSDKERKEMERIEDKVKAMFLEMTQRQRLVEAMRVSTEATTEAERVIEIENALRSVGLNLLEQEGTRRAMLANLVREMAVNIFNLTEAEKKLKEQEKERVRAIEEIGKAYLQTLPAGQRMVEEAKKWRDEQLKAIEGVKEGYDELRAKIDAVYNARLKEAQDRSLEDSKRWQDGIARGAKKMLEDIADDATKMEDMLVKAFKSAEDAFVEFVTTGKLSFGDFINSILADLARAFFQKAIMQPILGAIGSIFGMPMFHSGGVVGQTATSKKMVSASTIMSQGAIPKFHSGGGAGLRSDEMMAVLRRGEIVLTPEQMRAAGKSGGGAGVVVNVINNANGTEASTRESQGPDGSRIIEVMVEQKVASSLASRGSPVNRSLRNNFGANETLIKR